MNRYSDEVSKSYLADLRRDGCSQNDGSFPHWPLVPLPATNAKGPEEVWQRELWRGQKRGQGPVQRAF